MPRIKNQNRILHRKKTSRTRSEPRPRPSNSSSKPSQSWRNQRTAGGVAPVKSRRITKRKWATCGYRVQQGGMLACPFARATILLTSATWLRRGNLPPCCEFISAFVREQRGCPSEVHPQKRHPQNPRPLPFRRIIRVTRACTFSAIYSWTNFSYSSLTPGRGVSGNIGSVRRAVFGGRRSCSSITLGLYRPWIVSKI